MILDSLHFKVWYFSKHENDYLKIGKAFNWATMQKYKEVFSIFMRNMPAHKDLL